MWTSDPVSHSRSDVVFPLLAYIFAETKNPS